MSGTSSPFAPAAGYMREKGDKDAHTHYPLRRKRKVTSVTEDIKSSSPGIPSPSPVRGGLGGPERSHLYVPPPLPLDTEEEPDTAPEKQQQDKDKEVGSPSANRTPSKGGAISHSSIEFSISIDDEQQQKQGPQGASKDYKGTTKPSPSRAGIKPLTAIPALGIPGVSVKNPEGPNHPPPINVGSGGGTTPPSQQNSTGIFLPPSCGGPKLSHLADETLTESVASELAYPLSIKSLPFLGSAAEGGLHRANHIVSGFDRLDHSIMKLVNRLPQDAPLQEKFDLIAKWLDSYHVDVVPHRVAKHLRTLLNFGTSLGTTEAQGEPGGSPTYKSSLLALRLKGSQGIAPTAAVAACYALHQVLMVTARTTPILAPVVDDLLSSIYELIFVDPPQHLAPTLVDVALTNSNLRQYLEPFKAAMHYQHAHELTRKLGTVHKFTLQSDVIRKNYHDLLRSIQRRVYRREMLSAFRGWRQVVREVRTTDKHNKKVEGLEEQLRLAQEEIVELKRTLEEKDALCEEIKTEYGGYREDLTIQLKALQYDCIQHEKREASFDSSTTALRRALSEAVDNFYTSEAQWRKRYTDLVDVINDHQYEQYGGRWSHLEQYVFPTVNKLYPQLVELAQGTGTPKDSQQNAPPLSPLDEDMLRSPPGGGSSSMTSEPLDAAGAPLHTPSTSTITPRATPRTQALKKRLLTEAVGSAGAGGGQGQQQARPTASVSSLSSGISPAQETISPAAHLNEALLLDWVRSVLLHPSSPWSTVGGWSTTATAGGGASTVSSSPTTKKKMMTEPSSPSTSGSPTSAVRPLPRLLSLQGGGAALDTFAAVIHIIFPLDMTMEFVRSRVLEASAPEKATNLFAWLREKNIRLPKTLMDEDTISNDKEGQVAMVQLFGKLFSLCTNPVEEIVKARVRLNPPPPPPALSSSTTGGADDEKTLVLGSAAAASNTTSLADVLPLERSANGADQGRSGSSGKQSPLDRQPSSSSGRTDTRRHSSGCSGVQQLPTPPSADEIAAQLKAADAKQLPFSLSSFIVKEFVQGTGLSLAPSKARKGTAGDALMPDEQNDLGSFLISYHHVSELCTRTEFETVTTLLQKHFVVLRKLFLSYSGSKSVSGATVPQPQFLRMLRDANVGIGSSSGPAQASPAASGRGVGASGGRGGALAAGGRKAVATSSSGSPATVDVKAVSEIIPSLPSFDVKKWLVALLSVARLRYSAGTEGSVGTPEAFRQLIELNLRPFAFYVDSSLISATVRDVKSVEQALHEMRNDVFKIFRGFCSEVSPNRMEEARFLKLLNAAKLIGKVSSSTATTATSSPRGSPLVGAGGGDVARVQEKGSPAGSPPTMATAAAEPVSPVSPPAAAAWKGEKDLTGGRDNPQIGMATPLRSGFTLLTEDQATAIFHASKTASSDTTVNFDSFTAALSLCALCCFPAPWIQPGAKVLRFLSEYLLSVLKPSMHLSITFPI